MEFQHCQDLDAQSSLTFISQWISQLVPKGWLEQNAVEGPFGQLELCCPPGEEGEGAGIHLQQQGSAPA